MQNLYSTAFTKLRQLITGFFSFGKPSTSRAAGKLYERRRNANQKASPLKTHYPSSKRQGGRINKFIQPFLPYHPFQTILFPRFLLNMRSAFHSLAILATTILGIVVLVQAEFGAPCEADEEHACCPAGEESIRPDGTWKSCYECLCMVFSWQIGPILLISYAGLWQYVGCVENMAEMSFCCKGLKVSLYSLLSRHDD